MSAAETEGRWPAFPQLDNVVTWSGGGGFSARGGTWIPALEQAWPGVTVSRFEVRLEASALAMDIWLTASGSVESMVAAGLCSQEQVHSLPRGGVGHRGGQYVRLNRKSGRLSISDCVRHDAALFDAIVTAIAPAIWQPPRRAS